MVGFVQKGGVVYIYCCLVEIFEVISVICVVIGECDVLIGGDFVVSVGVKIFGLIVVGWIGVVVNSYEIIIGEFICNIEFIILIDCLIVVFEVWLREGLVLFNVLELVWVIMGDLIYFNMMIFGVVW